MPRRKALFSLLPMLAMACAGSGWMTPARGDAPASAGRCTDFRPEVAGVRIEELQAVTDRQDLPAFCAIRGTIEPAIGFEARFPLENWNGKYYQSGCGGYCGSVQPDKPGFSNSINEALKKGYAAITTDGGHRGWLGDASWAEGDPVAVEVYAQRLLPLTHAAGTALVRAYYGASSKLEYFGGCSNGGRLAAMAAQRYPELFDGIFGGSAVLDLSRNGGIFGSWVVQANTDEAGQRILTRENFAQKLPVLQRAVMQQCDAADGIEDGLIRQPRACAVDLAALPRCTGQAEQSCFDEREIAVVKKWYQGPRDAAGSQLFPGMPAGSEPYWLVWFLDADGATAPGNGLGGSYARYLGFADGGIAPGFTALSFDFDRDPPRLEANGRLLNATGTDLSAFHGAGGKLLMWHGWQDPLVLPDQAVEWHAGVLQAMGGAAEVDPFLRLFMIPGMGHCWELPSAAPDRFDPLAVLEDWVERDRPPRQLELLPLAAEAGEALIVFPHPGGAQQ